MITLISLPFELLLGLSKIVFVLPAKIVENYHDGNERNLDEKINPTQYEQV